MDSEPRRKLFPGRAVVTVRKGFAVSRVVAWIVVGLQALLVAIVGVAGTYAADSARDFSLKVDNIAVNVAKLTANADADRATQQRLDEWYRREMDRLERRIDDLEGR